jgi:hypothetical protein
MLPPLPADLERRLRVWCAGFMDAAHEEGFDYAALGPQGLGLFDEAQSAFGDRVRLVWDHDADDFLED